MPRARGVLLRDPLSDLFARLRNAQQAKRASLLFPESRFTKQVIQVLIQQGYVQDMCVIPPLSPKHAQFNHVKITLKYDEQGNGVIKKLRRVSKPSRRMYRGIRELPLASGGLGMWVLSTPKGVMHCAEARQRGVGGEVLGEVL